MLAKELLAAGRKADAVNELKIVVHQHPEYGDAMKMLNELEP